METQLQTLIKFVYDGSSQGTQTGDFMSLIIMLIAILGFCAVITAVIVKKYSYANIGKHSKGKVLNKGFALLAVAFGVVAAISCAVLLNNNNAHAQNNASINPSINAYVNDAGEVTIEDAVLDCEDTLVLQNITTGLCEGIEAMDNVNWTIKIDDQEVYNSSIPGSTEAAATFSGKHTVSFKTDMGAAKANSLVGKDVALVSFVLAVPTATINAEIDVPAGHGTISSDIIEDVPFGTTYTVDNSDRKITIGDEVIKYTDSDGWTLSTWNIANQNAPISGTITGDITFTATTIERNFLDWKPMSATTADGYNTYNFYPAFAEGDTNVLENYWFSWDQINEITVTKMKDIYDSNQWPGNPPTLYYKKIDRPVVDSLKCYRTYDAPWDFAFASEASETPAKATYRDTFMANYCSQGIYTAELDDNCCSNWDVTTDGSAVMPKINNIDYKLFYDSYGGQEGDYLSWNANSPWGSYTCGGDGNLNVFIYLVNSAWGTELRTSTKSVVLACDFN